MLKNLGLLQPKHRTKPRHQYPELLKEAEALAGTMTQKEIAQKLGITRETVQRHLHRRGIKTPRKTPKPPVPKKVRKAAPPQPAKKKLATTAKPAAAPKRPAASKPARKPTAPPVQTSPQPTAQPQQIVWPTHVRVQLHMPAERYVRPAAPYTPSAWGR